MTPTPTFILLVALFWTLPASAAVLAYRRHGSSLENLKRSVTHVLGAHKSDLQLQPDA